MKKSAYGKPLFINSFGKISEIEKVEAIDEYTIQDIIFKYPSCLPISEIDESYNPIIPICKELNTPVGPLDIFLITPDGELCIIETKLWRNPEARRKVIAQILDYAKELSNWSFEDLQREVNRKLGTKGNSLYDFVKNYDENLAPAEADFVDSVSRNLKRGKFLLLIAGDGIKENAKGIAEFLSNYANLNFIIAMIELNIFQNKNFGRLIIPQTIVKTVEISKMMIEVQDGMQITLSNESSTSKSLIPNSKSKEKEFYEQFWEEFVNELEFDDPGQPIPKPGGAQNLYVYPMNNKKVWISAYFAKSKKRIGVYFRAANDQIGNQIVDSLGEFTENIQKELGTDIFWSWNENGSVAIRYPIDDIFEESKREEIMEFFHSKLNLFVNVFRPKLKKIEQDSL